MDLHWIRRALMVAAIALAGPPPIARAAEPGFDLARYKGKAVYLDFWASWCGPCKFSFPFMTRLQSAYRDKGLVVVAVNVDHERARADLFLRQQNNTLLVVFDPKGEIATHFKVKDMPTSVMIDRTGRVRYVHEGFVQSKTPLYEQHIKELLNEP